MRHLLAATCLTPIALLSTAVPLMAETVIDNARTNGVKTSTATDTGADDIRVSSSGSIKPASGVAITIDSNHKVKNEGTIQFTGVNDAIAILANPGLTSEINNTGTITLDEEYEAKDTDNDGDLDGPLAQGSNRFGIRVAPGGTFTGNITNAGTITVEGNDSAAIAIDSALAGTLENKGVISVTGDRSFGIRANDVTADVKIMKAVSVKGTDTIGVALDGDVGGAVVVQSSIVSTGYRLPTPPSDQSKLDDDDLRQGGPALRITGNVAKGILFDIPPEDKNKDDDDEDKDGIKDADEGAASIVSQGSAPAVLIGGTDAITVGAVVGDANGYGLVIKGGVGGSGLYQNVDAQAIVIGGQGGAVTIAGGMSVSGNVGAVSAGGSATALRIGNLGTVNEINVSGSVGAAGGSAASSTVRGIVVDAGASVGKIVNSGVISATVQGTDGTATAILDRSGTLSLIETKGKISASIRSSETHKAIAIDLTSNTSGATVKQLAVSEGTAPSISGNVLFGSGDDVFDIADGTMAGDTVFGAGANRLALSGDATYTGKTTFGNGADTLSLVGTTRYTGDIDFGGGADTMTLGGTASFRGKLAGSENLAITLNGGVLDVTNTGNVALGSLTVGGAGTITINIDPETGTNTLYNVAGAASFEQGAKVRINLQRIKDSVGNFTFVRAGTLTGISGVSADTDKLPFMFAGSLVENQATGEAAINIRRKTTEELGFNGSETRAYDAIFNALDSDSKVAGVFLGLTDGDRFRNTIRQMLPNHAGGAFEAVTHGSRSAARILKDTAGPWSDRGNWGFWIQQAAFGTSKDLGDTAAYDVSGWGISAGAEIKTGGFGNVGISFGYLNGKDADGETQNEVIGSQYEAALYWRGQWDGLYAFARASAAMVDFKGSRFLTGVVGNETVNRAAHGSWDGMLYSASGGAAYEFVAGRFALRPGISFDYYRLKEDGYTETGGGKALDLSVDSRTSDEFAVNATMTFAYDLIRQTSDPYSSWLRIELDGGRRQLVGGSMGDTVSRFADGDDFTLVADKRKSGWTGGIRLVGGTTGFRLGGEFNAEEQQGRAAVAFRASLQIGL